MAASKRSGRIDIGVWGWMWGYGVGEIYPINGRFTGRSYLYILKNIMMPSVRALNPHGPIYILHDNSPIHKSNIVQEWFRSQSEINVINWPSLSPDLNPIEHLWSLIVSKWNPIKIKNKQQLLKHVEEQWEKLRGNPEICENLASSMKRRLNSVIESNGSHIKY